MTIKLKKFKDLISKNGLFSDGNWIESKDQNPDGSVRLIQLADIGVGKFIDKSNRFMTEERANDLNCTYLVEGDILVARMPDPIGRACIFPQVQQKCVTVVDICIIRPDSDQIDTRWLMHLINSKHFNNQVLQYVTGTTRQRISRGNLAKLDVEVPPLDEQKRIAAILDKADAIRRKRQQAIKLADDFLRSVFLDMFGDPVTNPKGWEVKKFSDLGNWASGGTPSRSVSGYFEGEINWFSARELNHRYLNESVEKITDEALSKSAAKIFPAGSMLVGMYDTAAFKISILNVASASNQACANIIPNEKIDIEWFFSFIEFSKETYLRQRRGVRQQNLNLGMIKDFDLPLPPKTEQEKFVKLAHKTMQMKERNYSSLSNSLDSFNSLSQKAFAGDL
ncbi:MAG: restriction endonuclease subunit S [Pseudoalteromonas nigrifaciens]|uniref:restriction endonuclease subunit S n=1 Tax=Pseudoalteromonas nigrifaciens TaxID=28109 RepID=UPI003F966A6F